MEDKRRVREERERGWRDRMIAAQAGDSASYEELLLELLPHVRSLVARRLSNPAEREDVVQNVFVSLHRARHTYRPERPVAPWLHAIVRNAVTDHMRSSARRQRREVSLEANGVGEPAAEAPPAVDAPLSPELERALGQLPGAQREAVELIHVEGLSVAEAAAQAGVTKSAIKVRAHRGYRALRALLDEGES